jgi:hypothetical protein
VSVADVSVAAGGHVHSYHRSWPSAGGRPTQRDYINPTVRENFDDILLIQFTI